MKRKRKSSKRKRLRKHERNPRPGIEICKDCGEPLKPDRMLGKCPKCFARELENRHGA